MNSDSSDTIRMGLMGGYIIFFKGKGKLHGIPVIKEFACEGNS